MKFHTRFILLSLHFNISPSCWWTLHSRFSRFRPEVKLQNKSKLSKAKKNQWSAEFASHCELHRPAFVLLKWIVEKAFGIFRWQDNLNKFNDRLLLYFDNEEEVHLVRLPHEVVEVPGGEGGAHQGGHLPQLHQIDEPVVVFVKHSERFFEVLRCLFEKMFFAKGEWSVAERTTFMEYLSNERS